jgi:uncharacterized delta-60 repeat protein
MKIYMRNLIAPLAPVVLSIFILLSLTACGGGGTPSINDQAFAVAVQSDGKIVAAGDSYSDNNGWSFALVRYNGNGSLDPAFGTGGKVLTNLHGGARAVAIQSDGKILAAGYSYLYPGNFVLVRYNSDGSLDTTFGYGGIVQTTMGGAVSTLAIQSDGRIVAGGYSYNGYGYDFAVARYFSNGTLDPIFSGGAVITANPYLNSGVTSVAIQSDGSILAAGGSSLIRYNIDGSPDMTFGNLGTVTTGSNYEKISGVAIQAGGQILAAGSAYNGVGGDDLILTRLNYIDGSIDTSFGSGGRIVAPAMSLYNLTSTSVVANQTTGKIVVAGYAQDQFAQDYFVVLARYDSYGIPDTSFASTGALLASAAGLWGNSGHVRNIAVQADGKIVVAGNTYQNDTNGYDFSLARFGSDGSVDNTFGTNGRVTTGF